MSKYIQHPEDYVSHDAAIKLKNLGFDYDVVHISGLESFPCTYIEPPKGVLAWANNTGMKYPTLYEAQKWLRKEKNIWIDIITDTEDGEHNNFNAVYYHKIIFGKDGAIEGNWGKSEPFKSPEEALSTGIDKSLEIIIQQEKINIQETFREILTRLLHENAGYYHPEEDGIVDEWIEELDKATDK